VEQQRGPVGRALNRLKWAAWTLLKRLGDAIGFDVVWRNYYTPIPNARELPEGFWSQPVELRGFQLDLTGQLQFLERELAPHIAEFRPPLESSGRPGEYFLDNTLFGSVDAEALYGLIRHLRPTRLVELGSGYSSLVIEAAAARNDQDGSPVEHRIFDPFPWLESVRPSGREVARVPATEVPLSEFEALSAGDVLFVDTTHTVKAGGDVNHIVLEVLPQLKPGVVIHFHDVFLPWQYPREWIEEMQWYWAEQYLLQAFLAYNREFEPLFAAHAVARADPERLARSVPSFTPQESPASFWIRRRETV
jgi:hypothetical protein